MGMTQEEACSVVWGGGKEDRLQRRQDSVKSNSCGHLLSLLWTHLIVRTTQGLTELLSPTQNLLFAPIPNRCSVNDWRINSF